VTCRPYFQCQSAAQCFLIAINNALQSPVLDHLSVQRLLRNMHCYTHPDGWYHAGDMSAALQTAARGLRLCEGAAHLGRTAGTTWQNTLAAQPHDMAHCDGVVLTLRHPDPERWDDTHYRTHTVAAVRLPHTSAPAAWYIMDSCLPGVMLPLSHTDVYEAFDAEVAYFQIPNALSAASRDQIAQHLRRTPPQSGAAAGPAGTRVVLHGHAALQGPAPTCAAAEPQRADVEPASRATHSVTSPDPCAARQRRSTAQPACNADSDWQSTCQPSCLPPAFVQDDKHTHPLVQALNNCLQYRVLDHCVVDAVLSTVHHPVPHSVSSGDYTVVDLATTVHVLSHTITLACGSPHTGRTRTSSWRNTLTAQSQSHAAANCALLIKHPHTTTPPHHASSAAAAIKLERRHTEPAWVLVDPASPHTVSDLDDPETACGFDADVFFLTFGATGAAVRRQEAAAILRPQAARCLAAWQPQDNPPDALHPLAPVPAQDGFHRSPQRFLLFAPPDIVLCRQTFQKLCQRVGLSSLLWAKYQQRDAHLLLTVTHQPHLRALDTDLHGLCAHVRTRTGWRLVPEGELTRRTCAAHTRPAPPNRPQHPRANSTRNGHNRFDVLALATAGDTSLPEAAPAKHCATQDPTAGNSRRRESTRASSIGTLNTGGLNKAGLDKLLGITAMMQENGITVLAMQETRVTCEAGDNSINGMLQQLGPDAMRYSYYGESAQLTTCAKPTGGTGFLVHDSVAPQVHYRGCLRSGDTHRATWLTVRGHTHADSLHIGNVYLPDSSKARANAGLYQASMNCLSQDIVHFESKPGRTVIIGDFNARVGRQTDGTADSRHLAPQCGEATLNPAGKQVLQLCSDRHLQFLSAQTPQSPNGSEARPTFHRGRATSIIDHILISDSEDATPAAVTLPHDSAEMRACGTDHTCVMVDILPQLVCGAQEERERVERWRLELLRQPTYTDRYREAIREEDRKSWAAQSQQGRDDASGVHTMAGQLDAIVSDAAMQTIGKRTVVQGITKRWMTEDALKAIRDRKAAHRQWKVRPTRANAQLLTRAHDRARQAVKAAQRAHRRQQASRLNADARQRKQPQHMHETLKSMARGRTAKGAPRILKHPVTGEEHSDLPGVLDCLVAHYKSLGAAQQYESEAQRDRAAAAAARVQTLSTQWHPVPGQDDEFTEAEVRSALTKMANNKAPGHDGIVAEMLKLAGAPVLRRLTDLFNKVLDTCTIPDGWRKGTIVSVFKAGDSTDPNNYRGITLLPVVDKLFTSLLASRIAEAAPCHFNQFGFCKGRGTAEAQFNFVCALQARILEKQSSHAFFLDIRKAFDTVNRSLILTKLYDKGVTGKLWHAVRTLYSDIRSRAASSGGVSDYFEILQGVAQGCPMSPVLFNIYIDNILCVLDEAGNAHGIETACKQATLGGQGYADDCNAIADTAPGLQHLTDALADCLENDLLLREARHKCKSMSFGPGPNHADPHLQWRGTAIEHQQSESLLGITITPDLSWLPQIARALRNGKYALHNWRPVLRSTNLNIDVKLLMVKTHIVPAMTYGLAVWCPSTPQEWAEFKKLTTVLTDALKECLGASWARRQGHLTRCLKGDVLLADFGLPSIQTESEAAHLRFHFKHADATNHTHDAEGSRSLTTAGPWAARSDELLAGMAATQCRTRSSAAPSNERAQGCQPTPDNAEISAALHQAALTRAHATLAGAHRCYNPSRRAREHRKTFAEPMCDIVFCHRRATLRRNKPSALCRQEYLRAPQRHAVAITALRSGHLLDEFKSTEDGGIQQLHQAADAECPHCHEHVPFAQTDCARDLPWCHIAHKLLECKACLHWRAGLPAFCASMLTNAASHDGAYHNKLAELFSDLQAHPGAEHNCSAPPLDSRLGFLSLLADPLAHEQPDVAAWDGILQAVGTLLCSGQEGARGALAGCDEADQGSGDLTTSDYASDADSTEYDSDGPDLPCPFTTPPPSALMLAELLGNQPAGDRGQGPRTQPAMERARLSAQRPYRAEDDSEDEVELNSHEAEVSVTGSGVSEAVAPQAGAMRGAEAERAGSHAGVPQQAEVVDSDDEVVLARPVPSPSGGRGLCPDGWR